VTPALRRIWWVLGAVLVALVGWFVRSGMGGVDAAPLSVARPVPRLVAADSPMTAAAVATTPEVPAATPHGSDEIELCGGLWVKLKDDGNVDEDDLRRVVRLPEARAQLTAALRADASEFARAASVWLALAGSEAGRLAMLGAVSGCKGAECEASREATARFAEGRDALARMAAATNDPQVYALAFNTCGRAQPNAGACQLLSAEQWARLDPDNATPWLFVLEQAGQRRDVAAQNEALFRLSASRRSDQHFFALPGLMLMHLSGDEAALPAALVLATEAIGVEAAWSLPGYQNLVAMCRPPALRDSNRRQTCSAVAELLVERADTLLERGIGTALGRHLGWPAERLERLRGEQTAYGQMLAAKGADTPFGGCAEIRRDVAFVERQARLGEVGAMREWVAQSGLQSEDFIRTERAAQAKAAEAAAFAASAASAPR
jgi:hypothetical protein